MKKVNIKYLQVAWGPGGRKVVRGQMRAADNDDEMLSGELSLAELLTLAGLKSYEVINAQEVLNTVVIAYGFGA
jgi:hypothetical protein